MAKQRCDGTPRERLVDLIELGVRGQVDAPTAVRLEVSLEDLVRLKEIVNVLASLSTFKSFFALSDQPNR